MAKGRILIIVLMISILVGLTACGDVDDEEKSQSSNRETKDDSKILSKEDEQKGATSPEEFVENFVNYINNGNVENIIDSIDIVGMYALSLSLPGENSYISTGTNSYENSSSDYEDVMKFENAYELVESIKDDSISKAIKEFEENEDYYLFEMAGKEVLTRELTDMKDDIYESIIDEKAGIRKIFFFFFDDVKIKIEKTGKAKKQINSDGLYELNIQISGSAKVNGKKESFEDEDDIYVMEKDGEYYLVYSKWMGLDKYSSNNIFHILNNNSYSEEGWIRNLVESQINDCKRDYYADDDYQDTKFSETVTEADVCGNWTTGLFTVKSMDTNKKYFGADDLYKGSDELLVDVDKLYFVNTYDTMEYYYATFKEGKDGSIELDELKQYEDGKWSDIEKANNKKQESVEIVQKTPTEN